MKNNKKEMTTTKKGLQKQLENKNENINKYKLSLD